MAKEFLKRWSPNAEKIKQYRVLRIFGGLLRYDYLWRLQRSSAARGIAIGLFCCWMPVPFQMPMAAAGAILFRGYLPISMATVWLTNPVTMAPAMVIAYQIGQIILGGTTDTEAISSAIDALFAMEFTSESLSYVWSSIEGILWPLLFGCFLLGSASAGVGYFLVMETWRLSVMRRWRNRKKKWGQWQTQRAAKRALKSSQKTTDNPAPDVSCWQGLTIGQKVTLTDILDPTVTVPNRFDQRQPRVGDTAEIVGIHTEPTAGFELKCDDPDSQETIWLRAIAPDDLVVQVIS